MSSAYKEPCLKSRAEDLGMLLERKQRQYSSVYLKAGEFLSLLYPDGIKLGDYSHALMLARIFEKCARIANLNRNLDDENPYQDIAGYGILGQVLWEKEKACKSSQIPEPLKSDTRRRSCEFLRPYLSPS